MKIHSCGVNPVHAPLRLPKHKWEFYLGAGAVDQPQRLHAGSCQLMLAEDNAVNVVDCMIERLLIYFTKVFDL